MLSQTFREKREGRGERKDKLEIVHQKGVEGKNSISGCQGPCKLRSKRQSCECEGQTERG